jgi:signal transduction histidine kinase
MDFFDHARAVHAIRVTASGEITGCNEAASSHLGMARNELIGRSIFDFITNPDVHRLTNVLAGRSNNTMALSFTGRRQLPYTLQCWIAAEGSDMLIVGEPPLEDDRNLQTELMKVTEDLAVLARERSRLLDAERRARAEADTTNREKDRALATIGHELRQPLGAMRFAVELLASDAPPESHRRATQAIQRQLTQLTRMVDDLLDAARVRENKLRLTRTRLDLKQLLTEVAEAGRARSAERSISFEVRMPDPPVWVDADAARLVQVFSNLIDNAIKYSDAGGRVAIELSNADGAARVAVRDSGRGIAPDALPRIFRLFAQQSEGERGGLGIGLAVAHGIVLLHEGTIEASSEGPGRGAEFTVTLPLSKAQ